MNRGVKLKLTTAADEMKWHVLLQVPFSKGVYRFCDRQLMVRRGGGLRNAHVRRPPPYSYLYCDRDTRGTHTHTFADEVPIPSIAVACGALRNSKTLGEINV
jgi:hypothetical protein